MPKKNYPTFTSLRKESGFVFQDPAYGVDEYRTKKLMNEAITVRLQRGVEFDVFKECESGNFRKYVEDGYLKDGQKVKLDPKDLQRFLESKVKGTNRAVTWDKRPRSAEERRLEAIVEQSEVRLAEKDQTIEELRKQLAKGKQ